MEKGQVRRFVERLQHDGAAETAGKVRLCLEAPHQLRDPFILLDTAAVLTTCAIVGCHKCPPCDAPPAPSTVAVFADTGTSP